MKCNNFANNKMYKGLSVSNLTIKKNHPIKINPKIVKDSNELFKDCVVRSNRIQHFSIEILNGPTNALEEADLLTDLPSISMAPLADNDYDESIVNDELLMPPPSLTSNEESTLSDFDCGSEAPSEPMEIFKTPLNPLRNRLNFLQNVAAPPPPLTKSGRSWQHLEICFLLRQYEQHMASLRYKESKINFWYLIAGLMQSKGFNVSQLKSILTKVRLNNFCICSVPKLNADHNGIRCAVAFSEWNWTRISRVPMRSE